MKNIIAILLTFFCLNTYATNYYFSNAGNDANAGTIGSPWASIAKFNSVFSSKLPGDFFLFNRGDVFSGNMIPNRSGSSGSPITIGAYGTGANPIITGLTSITAWTSLPGNIWESTAAVTTLTTLNMVVINGANTGMGRFPNTGYLVYQSHTGTTTITSSSLNSAVTNWTGAEVVLRSTPWLLQRQPISAQAGGQITYTGAETPRDGYGFFIQNDARTLDVVNEWYFVPGTKKLRIYNTVSPTNVQVATIDELVLNSLASWITYDHIDFKGANTNLFETRNSQHIIITNCSFLFAGRTAIMSNNAVSSNGLATIDGNTISDNNESALKILSFTDVFTVQNNSINNTGMIPGAGNPSDQQNTADAIDVNGSGSIIQNNNISNTGHIGVAMRQRSNITAQNNFIKNSTQVRYDGGAIYSWNADTLSIASRFIDGNICINNIIPIEGIGTGDPIVCGIYLDGSSKNTTITGNTVSGYISEGIHILGSGSVTITGNTCYSNGNLSTYALPNGSAFGMLHFTSAGGETINNLIVKNNIFFAKNANQFCFFYRNDDATYAFGYTDSNYFARPILDNLTFRTTATFTNTDRNIAMWQGFSGLDAASKKCPVTITNVNQLFFAYDSTGSPITVTLPAGTWIDVFGTSYNTGSDVLQPYTSRIYINTGTNIAPTANAGTDKNITLPTTSVSATGSGNDPDGTIAAYAWSFVSGPATGTATPSNTATTTLGGMTVQGIYKFLLKVTDNFGLTGVDTMSVVVNASTPVNLPPVVDAGGNKVITLPTNTITQVGNVTDPDGTVASVSWVADPTNPIPTTFGSSTSTTTSINGMFVGGPYRFTLFGTDNLGAVGSQTITVQVNAPAPIPPVANAGSDQTITWPTAGITLAGSGTDADGVIVAYQWSRLSGSGTITNPNSAGTTVTGMIPGVSQFQLQVTDNSGATGVDAMTVTLNQGSESLSASGTTVTYTGGPLAPIITTSPPGLAFNLLIDGVSSSVINAGAHPYTAGGADPNWTATPISGTFTVNKAAATIIAPNVTANFDGLTHPGVATTSPAGLTGITHSYSSGSAPTAIGVYHDTIRLVNSNYQATQVVISITIVSSSEIIFISDSTFTFDSTAHNVTVTTAYTYSLVGSPRTNAGSNQVIATITQVGHTGADTANITVLKRQSILSWIQPTNMPDGSLLSALQLNATADVAGHYVYNHPLGERLQLGPTIVTGTFVPDDPSNILGGTILRTINVFAVDPFEGGSFIIMGPGGQILFYKP